MRSLLATIDEPVPAEPWLMQSEERARSATKESLEDAAEALTEAGLKSAARLVRETAARRPREIDFPPCAPIAIGLRGMNRKDKRFDSQLGNSNSTRAKPLS